MTPVEIAGLAILTFSAGTLLGHAAGYGRALDVVKRRAGLGRARYRRVGRPE